MFNPNSRGWNERWNEITCVIAKTGMLIMMPSSYGIRWSGAPNRSRIVLVQVLKADEKSCTTITLIGNGFWKQGKIKEFGDPYFEKESGWQEVVGSRPKQAQ